MIPPEVVFLSISQAERVNAAVAASHTPHASPAPRRHWRRALSALVHFVRIPLACAAIVALLTRGTPGQPIAYAVAAVVLVAGVALGASALMPPRRSAGGTTLLRQAARR